MGNYTSFGDIVSDRIKESNMSMRELAKRVDVDVSYISKIISNKRTNPSYQIVMKLAHELGIHQYELEEIFDLDSPSTEKMAVGSRKELTGEEKVKIKEITDIIFKNQFGNLKAVANILYIIDELENIKKTRNPNEKYYTVTFAGGREVRILETDYLDYELLSLYCAAINSKIGDCLIMKGNVEALPDTYSAIMATLEDMVDQANYVEESGLRNDDLLKLRDYIKRSTQDC